MTNKKDFGYAKKATTAIWHEQPSQHNPYAAEKCRLHGYDVVELSKQKNFADVLLLMFKGELPDQSDSQLFNSLLIALISPGPRHPATRAVMTAGISKTNTPHILPIGLMVLGGEYNGAADVEKTMQFIKRNRDTAIADFCKQNPQAPKPEQQNDWRPYPGIGSAYGSIEPVTVELATYMATLPSSGENMAWLQQLISHLADPQVNWLAIGLFSAVMLDLDIAPREGGGLFQLLSAPGLLAHGLEQTHKPIKSMPFLDDDQYELTENN